jgi:hypothetical protein
MKKLISMELTMKSPKNKPLVDERIEFLTNKYASDAFKSLVYYLGISIVIKSFTLDANIFIYWDNAIAIVFAVLYMIFRSAEEGAPVSPSTLNPMNWKSVQLFLVIGLIFGLFTTFYIAGMEERWDAFFSTVPIKIGGTVVIGVLFTVLMIFLVWLFDAIPTKRALKRAAELADEPEPELHYDDKFIKQSHIQDERIDSINNKYSAHGFYTVSIYILLSTIVKFLALNVSLIYYYDAFLAAMAAAGYFSIKMIRSGAYVEPELSQKDQRYNFIIITMACLAFGMFNAFITFPMAENWAELLNGQLRKISFGLLMAALFGIGYLIIGKAANYYAKKQADLLSENE